MAKVKQDPNIDPKILHKIIKSHNIENGKKESLELIAKELNYKLNSKKRKNKLRYRIVQMLRHGLD